MVGNNAHGNEDEGLSTLRSLANAILGKTGKPDRLDTATRMAMDVDFSDKDERPLPNRRFRSPSAYCINI